MIDQQDNQCRQDNQNCLNTYELIQGHWGIATALANEYRNIPKIDFEDILQHARIGLFKASQKYDATKGASFTTFAWHIIKNDLNSLYTKQHRYAQRENFSLDSIWIEDGEGGADIQEAIEDEHGNVCEGIQLREEMEVVHEALCKLPDRQQKVIRGFLADEDYRTIGRNLGFAEGSAKTLVSRAYKKSLKNLRKELKKQGVQHDQTGVNAKCLFTDKLPINSF